MKDYNIQSCQWMVYHRFHQSHKLTNVGYVKNIYLQPLVFGNVEPLDNVYFVISS